MLSKQKDPLKILGFDHLENNQQWLLIPFINIKMLSNERQIGQNLKEVLGVQEENVAAIYRIQDENKRSQFIAIHAKPIKIHENGVTYAAQDLKTHQWFEVFTHAQFTLSEPDEKPMAAWEINNPFKELIDSYKAKEKKYWKHNETTHILSEIDLRKQQEKETKSKHDFHKKTDRFSHLFEADGHQFVMAPWQASRGACLFRDWLLREPEPSFQDVARVWRKTVESIEQMHAAGILHGHLDAECIVIDGENKNEKIYFLGGEQSKTIRQFAPIPADNPLFDKATLFEVARPAMDFRALAKTFYPHVKASVEKEFSALNEASQRANIPVPWRNGGWYYDLLRNRHASEFYIKMNDLHISPTEKLSFIETVLGVDDELDRLILQKSVEQFARKWKMERAQRIEKLIDQGAIDLITAESAKKMHMKITLPVEKIKQQRMKNILLLRPTNEDTYNLFKNKVSQYPYCLVPLSFYYNDDVKIGLSGSQTIKSQHRKKWAEIKEKDSFCKWLRSCPASGPPFNPPLMTEKEKLGNEKYNEKIKEITVEYDKSLKLEQSRLDTWLREFKKDFVFSDPETKPPEILTVMYIDLAPAMKVLGKAQYRGLLLYLDNLFNTEPFNNWQRTGLPFPKERGLIQYVVKGRSPLDTNNPKEQKLWQFLKEKVDDVLLDHGFSAQRISPELVFIPDIKRNPRRTYLTSDEFIKKGFGLLTEKFNFQAGLELKEPLPSRGNQSRCSEEERYVFRLYQGNKKPESNNPDAAHNSETSNNQKKVNVKN